MFAIKINDTFLDLSEKSSANFTLNNPLFDEGFIDFSFSFPFSLSCSPTNVNALEQPHRLDSSGKKLFKNAVLYLLGMPFERGELRIVKTTSKKIQVVFKNVMNAQSERFEKIRIKDTLGSDAVTATVTTQFFFDVIPGYNQYFITVNGQQYTYNASPSDSVATIVFRLSTLISDDHPSFVFYQNGQEQLIINRNGQPLINFTPLGGLQIGETPTTGSVHAGETEVYVQNIVQNPVNTHAFPVLYWQNFYDGKNEAFLNWINYYLDGATISNTLLLREEWAHTYVPFIYLKYVVESVCQRIGINLDTSVFWDNSEIQQLLLFNNKSIDQLFKDGNQFINGFAYTINFADHVPDLSAKELFEFIAEKFALYLTTQDNTLRFNKKIDQLDSEAIDWTAKSEPEYLTDHPEESEGIWFGELPEFDQFRPFNQLIPYTEGNPDEKFSNHFGTPNMFDRSTLRVPNIDQPGTTPKTGEQEYDLRLLYYRGLQPDTADQLYPLATHEVTNAKGETIATEALDPMFIFKKYQAPLYKYAENRIVTKRIRLTVADLLEIKKWENSRRTIRHQQGTLHGIIKSVKFKVSQQGLSVATVELVSEI